MNHPPVVIVASGGVPRTPVADGVSAPAFTVVESGARPITLAENSPPIALFNPDGTSYGVSVEHTANAVIDTDLATYTFSSQSLGAAFASRKIVVGVGARRAAPFTFVSVTVGGVAAAAISGTELVFASSLSRIALYQADVPDGTTGDIVVTCSAATLRCGIGVWALANANAVVDTGTSITDPATDTISVSAKGAIIGYGFHTGLSAATTTWTGINEDFDEVVETLHTHTGASAAFAVGEAASVSCDWSVAPDAGAAICLASFGP